MISNWIIHVDKIQRVQVAFEIFTDLDHESGGRDGPTILGEKVVVQ